MEKTVVFEFQDDFEFPEKFTEKKCNAIFRCPFYQYDDYGCFSHCFLIGDYDPCPFYDGADITVYDGP